MNRIRPKFVARKSIIPAFKFKRLLFLLIFGGLAAFSATIGKETIEGISFLAPYVSLMPIVFAAPACIPLIIILVDIIQRRHEYCVFYDSYYIKKEGVFRRHEERCVFPKVLTCTVDRKFLGIIFRFGNVYAKAIGPWFIELKEYKKPLRIRKLIVQNFISRKEVKSMRQTVLTK